MLFLKIKFIISSRLRTELLALKTRFGLLPNEPVLPVPLGSTLPGPDTPPATTSSHSHKKPRNSESSAGSSQQHQFPSQIQLQSPLQFTTGDSLPSQVPPAPELKAIPISVTVPKMLSEHVSSQWSSLPVSGTRSTPAVAVASVHPISLATFSTIPLAIVAPAQASQAGRAHPHALVPAISPNGVALPLLQANALSQLPVTVAAMQLQPPPLHPLPRDRPREDELQQLEEPMLELEDDLELELDPATSDEHETLEGAQASPVSAAPLVNNSLLQLVSSLQQQPNVLTSLLLLAAQQQVQQSSSTTSVSGSGAPDMSLLPLVLLAQSSGSSSDSLLSALLTLRSATGAGSGAQSAAQSAPSSSSANGNSSANLTSAVKMLSALLGGVRPANEREEKPAPRAEADEAAQLNDVHTPGARAEGPPGGRGTGGRQATRRPARGGYSRPLRSVHLFLALGYFVRVHVYQHVRTPILSVKEWAKQLLFTNALIMQLRRCSQFLLAELL